MGIGMGRGRGRIGSGSGEGYVNIASEKTKRKYNGDKSNKRQNLGIFLKKERGTRQIGNDFVFGKEAIGGGGNTLLIYI